jgi:type IV pilus assembly protein PilF
VKQFRAGLPAAALAALLAMPGAAVAQARAPSENPTVTAARFNAQLGIEYLKQNNLAAAQEKIERALQQNPKDAGAHTAAGLLYERLREPRKADQHYSRALKLDPRNPQMQNNYAVFLCRNGESAKGRTLFEQAATNPLYRTPEVAYANAGVCARSAKDYEAAEANFRKALQMRPTMTDALLQMADLSLERGNGLQSRAFIQRFLQAAPATPEVLLLAARVERTLGDEKAAGDYETRLRNEFPGSQQAGQLADGRAQGG